jgi:hypothetical protein
VQGLSRSGVQLPGYSVQLGLINLRPHSVLEGAPIEMARIALASAIQP